jgi:hypothetical protein
MRILKNSYNAKTLPFVVIGAERRNRSKSGYHRPLVSRN